jgi:hypothetical protein
VKKIAADRNYRLLKRAQSVTGASSRSGSNFGGGPWSKQQKGGTGSVSGDAATPSDKEVTPREKAIAIRQIKSALKAAQDNRDKTPEGRKRILEKHGVTEVLIRNKEGYVVKLKDGLKVDVLKSEVR